MWQREIERVNLTCVKASKDATDTAMPVFYSSFHGDVTALISYEPEETCI